MDGLVNSTVKGQIMLIVGQAQGRDVEFPGSGLLVDAGEDGPEGAELGGADLLEGGGWRDCNGGQVDAGHLDQLTCPYIMFVLCSLYYIITNRRVGNMF